MAQSRLPSIRGSGPAIGTKVRSSSTNALSTAPSIVSDAMPLTAATESSSLGALPASPLDAVFDPKAEVSVSTAARSLSKAVIVRAAA